jgi:hypothetical protein
MLQAWARSWRMEMELEGEVESMFRSISCGAVAWVTWDSLELALPTLSTFFTAEDSSSDH